MFHYEHCVVTNVVDGDTFDVEFDLGFKTKTKWRCRLKGFDTPETTWRAACPGERLFGEHATELVTKLILHQPVSVTTHKIGIYNRYIAEIFYQDPDDPMVIHSLRETLIREQHHKRDIDCRRCPHQNTCEIIDEVYEKLKLRWRDAPAPA